MKDDRGAAAVEMALVLPLLLLVLFGIVDFGRMLNAQLTITEGAREGARAAALGYDIGTRVGAATGGLTGVTFVEDDDCDTDTTADATVTVTHQFQFVTPFAIIAGMFGTGPDETFAIDAVGVMPCAG